MSLHTSVKYHFDLWQKSALASSLFITVTVVVFKCRNNRYRMGGGSSTPRNITLEQEEASGVVKVSEAVANRLVGKPEPLNSPTFSEGSRLSIEENEAALRKLDNRYEKKIKLLEKQNRELHQTTTEAFAKAVEEVEEKFLKTTASPICDDLQKDVMRCYQDNPKQTLNCSRVVKAYSSCVQQQRESILTNKEECQPCLLAQMARGPCGIYFMKAYDCYLEDKDQDECARLYLDMKTCWDKHPESGYDKIIDKAYSSDDKKTATKPASVDESRSTSMETQNANSKKLGDSQKEE